MQVNRTLTLFVAFLIYTYCVYAQPADVKFDHLTVEDGLSNGAVYAILQDSRGFMWFGTRFGLNRYDGLEFKVFGHDPKNPNSLPGYQVTAICEDWTGAIWVGTFNGGLAKFDRKTEQFTNYFQDSADPNTISSNFITAIYEDSQQNLWVGTENGLNKYNRNQNSFITYYHDPVDSQSICDNRITSFCEIPSGTLWIGTKSGSLIKIDLKSSFIENLQDNPFRPTKAATNIITSLVGDPNENILWVTMFPIGLIKVKLNNMEINFYRISTDDPNMASTNGLFSSVMDENGNLWMGSVDGVTFFNPTREEYVYNRFDEYNPFSVSDYVIQKTYIDNQGILWVGTASKGVDKFNPKRLRFDHIKQSEKNPEGFQGTNVFSFDEDKEGLIWIGATPKGTNRFDPISGTFKYYQSDDSDPEVWSRNYVKQVLVDHYNKIWIGTFAAGLFELDPITENINHYRHVPDQPRSISDNDIYALYETMDGTLWVGTQGGGLNRFNRESGSFTHFTHDPSDTLSISSNDIYVIFEDHSGTLWIGTADGGLNRYEPLSESFTALLVSDENRNSISSNCVLSLFEDARNNLWIGTRSGGLNKLNPDRKTFSILDLGDEPSNLEIASILQDDDGFLWLGTTNGILKADPDSGLVNSYHVKDGLQSSQFYYSSSLKDSRGYFYFGGVNGFNRFHPDSIVNNNHLPPVVITDFKINYEEVPIGLRDDGRIILKESITQTKELTLTHNDKTVSFTFAALDYSDPARNRFAYYLEGFDDNWIQAGFRRFVTYTSLAPGQYTFQVKASNNDGVWNHKGVSLAITVLPPFWKTWWFILCEILLLGAIVSAGFFMRLRAVEKRERRKAHEQQMKLKLDHQQRELVTKSMDLIEKQDFLEEILYDMKLIKEAKPQEQARILRQLIQRLSHLTSFNHVWEEFEKWFTEIHTGFIHDLSRDFPKLSAQEIKVCALLRLNMQSKEIAGLMNIEPATVEIYRYRIRKKLGLSKGKNLIKFISKY